MAVVRGRRAGWLLCGVIALASCGGPDAGSDADADADADAASSSVVTGAATTERVGDAVPGPDALAGVVFDVRRDPG